MKVINWGMIGCGSVAERKSSPAFYKAPGSALVAVMGRRPAAAQDYATCHGIAKVYSDAAQLIADLASHGLDLFQYLLGDIVDVTGCSARQAGLYAAEDAVAASWRFANGALGTGCWSFVADRREDRVDIIGSKGRIGFSVFDEYPVRLDADEQLSLQIANPEHIQWHHVLGMNAHIRGTARHPAVAAQALKTDWVMDRILGRQ